jgi:hypothetical protein
MTQKPSTAALAYVTAMPEFSHGLSITEAALRLDAFAAQAVEPWRTKLAEQCGKTLAAQAVAARGTARPLPAGLPLSLGCIQDGVCRATPCICAQAAERAKSGASDLERAAVLAKAHVRPKLTLLQCEFEEYLAAEEIADALAEARRDERVHWFTQLRNLPEDLQKAMCKGWLPGPQESATFIADWLEKHEEPPPATDASPGSPLSDNEKQEAIRVAAILVGGPSAAAPGAWPLVSRIGDYLRSVSAEARRAGAEEMRERAAQIAQGEGKDCEALYILEGFPEDLKKRDASERIAKRIKALSV